MHPEDVESDQSDFMQPELGKEDLRVLVVDDDDAFRLQLKRYLSMAKNFGMQTFFVKNGRHAMRFCEARMPDLILLDYEMPDMSGLEFLHALRELPEGHMPAVILLTGMGSEQVATDAMKKGAIDYVSNRKGLATTLCPGARPPTGAATYAL